MARRKYRAAVIGAGFIGSGYHVPAYLSQAERCELVAIADAVPGKAEYVAKRNGIQNVYTDPYQMLREMQPDVVSVCVPNNDHKKMAIAALEAGANVICEKPMTMTLADAKEMYAVADRVGRILTPCQNDRFGYRQIVHDMVQDGLLGDVYFGECESVRRRGIPNWGVFHMKEYNSGGPFCDIGVHFIDSMMYILGNPRFEAAFAKTWAKIAPQERDEVNTSRVDQSSTFIPRPYRNEEFSVEDHAAGSLRFAGDLMLNFKFSWALNTRPSDGFRLHGTRAGLIFDKMDKDMFRLYSNIGKTQVDSILRIDPVHRFRNIENPGIWLLIDQFLNALDGTEEFIIKREEVLNVCAVIEAVYKSAELNREVTMGEIEG